MKKLLMLLGFLAARSSLLALVLALGLNAADSNIYIMGDCAWPPNGPLRIESNNFSCMQDTGSGGLNDYVQWNWKHGQSLDGAEYFNVSNTSSCPWYATPTTCTSGNPEFTLHLGPAQGSIIGHLSFVYTPTTNSWDAGTCLDAQKQPCQTSYLQVAKTACPTGINSTNCFKLSGSALQSSSSSSAVQAATKAPAQKSAKSFRR